jgi:GDP-L-fucose synthase
MTSAFEPGPLDRSRRVYIAGHRGLVGSALWRQFEREGFTGLLGRTSAEFDLRDQRAVETFFAEQRPEIVIMAAAKVGGIMANKTYPAEFISDNLRVQVNVLDAAYEHSVERLLFLGSSCIYPRDAAQPITEDALLSGPLEPTSDAYAIAKIAGVLQVQAQRRQYGVPHISAMPTNLYGPNDNFDAETAHVLPALLRRFVEAKESGQPQIQLWGSGAPRREFLHVDDLARACLCLLEGYDAPEPINVGYGSDVSIAVLAQTLAEVTGYEGELCWDTSKPDGTPRKLLDTSRLQALGWKPTITLADGIASTYAWFTEHREQLRAGKR